MGVHMPSPQMNRTMTRPFNFSAGPAALPEDVLQQAAAEMLDWHGSGMSVMEMSHRGKEFITIAQAAEADLRTLLGIPAHFKVLFMQGGAIAENAILPMNLSRGGLTDYVVTGSWSEKSAKEARKYAQVHIAADNTADAHTTLPAFGSWQLSQDAAYVHVCSNETIHGVEMHELPDLAALGSTAPLIIDCSSHLASRPFTGGYDWSRIGVAYAGAQKNIGPSSSSAKTCWATPCPSRPRPLITAWWPRTNRCTTRRPPTPGTSPAWCSSGRCARQRSRRKAS